MSEGRTPALTITLLGSYRLTDRTGAPIQLSTRKAWSLLALLSVEPDVPHTRPRIARLLWPELPPPQALHNLRQTLLLLRRTLHEAAGDCELLEVNDTHLKLAPFPRVRCDAAEFLPLGRQCVAHAHRHPAACLECVVRATRMVELYGGDLLGAWSPDSHELIAWREGWRVILNDHALCALKTLVDTCERAGRLVEALEHAKRRVELEPSSEEAHREYMRLLVRCGRRAAAIRHYEGYEQWLSEQVGSAPEVATAELFDRIWAGQLPTMSAPREGVELAGGSSIPVAMTPFFGRRNELERLQRALSDPGQRVAWVVGPPGAGKTRLALEAAGAWGWQFQGGVQVLELDGEQGLRTLIERAGAPRSVDARAARRSVEQQAPTGTLFVLDDADLFLERPDAAKLLSALASRGFVLVTATWVPPGSEGYLLEIGGLEVPEEDDPEAVDAASIQLFLDQARRVVGPFAMSRDIAAQIARVCRTVEGLPLWIELLASQLDRYSLRELAMLLRRDPGRLRCDFIDIPDHHRSPRHVARRALERLPAEARQLLLQMAEQRGEAGLPGGAGMGGAAISAALESLRRHHWLHPHERASTPFWPPPMRLVIQSLRG